MHTEVNTPNLCAITTISDIILKCSISMRKLIIIASAKIKCYSDNRASKYPFWPYFGRTPRKSVITNFVVLKWENICEARQRNVERESSWLIRHWCIYHWYILSDTCSCNCGKYMQDSTDRKPQFAVTSVQYILIIVETR